MAFLEILDLWITKPLILLSGLPILLFFWLQSLEPEVASHEPPAIRPRIPYIGHFLTFFREQSLFLTNLSKAYGLPAITIPVFKKRQYALFDPLLVQSAYCSKDLSFTPFAIDNVRSLTGHDDASQEIVKTTDIIPVYFRSMYDGTTAQHIHSLNVHSLKYVSEQINDIGPDGLVAPNTYIWLRNLMTIATNEGLYGPRNPFRDLDLVEDIWTFESGLAVLMFHLFPTKLLKRALAARRRIQDALYEFCSTLKDDDEEVSAYIRNRVAILRKYGITEKSIGDIEVALIHVPTSNSIPTMFWVFIHIFTRPELVLQLRAEAEAIAEHGPNREVTINVDALTEKCPLLISTFREVSRVCNKFTCNRRVIKDTTITDGNGRSYLLKQGHLAQMPSYPLHSLQDAWGSDADEFRPDRFMDENLTSKEAKLRRAAFTPFGGGAHMCPGRNFATAEIIGFVTSTLLGYQVEPTDGNWENFKPPPMAPCPMATAVCKPENEDSMFGFRMTRRKGWESTNWKFTSGPVKG